MESKKNEGMYDTRVAARRLRGLVGSGPEHLAARNEAGRALISEFMALARKHGLTPTPTKQGCSVEIQDCVVMVDLDPANGIVQYGRRDTMTLRNVPLVFNVGTGIFEGQTVDTETHPPPGEPHPWRSALDVLVENVVTISAGVTR